MTGGRDRERARREPAVEREGGAPEVSRSERARAPRANREDVAARRTEGVAEGNAPRRGATIVTRTVGRLARLRALIATARDEKRASVLARPDAPSALEPRAKHRASRDARRGREVREASDRSAENGDVGSVPSSSTNPVGAEALGTRRRTGRLLFFRFRPGISTHTEGIDRVAFKPAPYETRNSAAAMPACDSRRRLPRGRTLPNARRSFKRVPPQWRRLFSTSPPRATPFSRAWTSTRSARPRRLWRRPSRACARDSPACNNCAPEASARRGALARAAPSRIAPDRERDLPRRSRAMRRARSRVSSAPFASAAAFRSRRF